MILVDTHIHLDADDFRHDLEEVINEAITAQVKWMLIPNVDRTTSEKVLEIAHDHPQHCFPMMGVHPTSVKEDHEEEIRHAEQLLRSQTFVAIGEIGIDLYWDKTFYAEQQKAFVHQMHLARELKLPAVIHSRKSLEELMLLIRKEKLEDIPAVFHCFPGSVEQARRLTDQGYYLGIGGVVSFKNAEMARVVKEVPLESILLETDAPWLAPVPWRGRRNEPKYIELIAKKIAEIRETSLEEVAEKTTAAAQRLFTLPAF